MLTSVTQSASSGSAIGSPIYRHLSWLSLAITFFSDFLTPLGFAHGNFYLIPIILAALSGDHHRLLRIGLVSALLCSFGLFVAEHPEGVSYLVAIANRFSSLIVIAATLTLGLTCLYHRNQIKQSNQNQAAIELSKQRHSDWLKLITQQAGVEVWWYDALKDKLHGSGQLAQLHGLDPASPVTLAKALGAYSKADQKKLEHWLSQCLTQGTGFDEELPLRTTDGRDLWLRTNGQAQRNNEGHIVAVLGFVQDLTQRRKLSKQLRTNHQQMQLLLNTIPLIVWTAKPDGTIDYMNKPVGDFTGATEEQLSEPGYWLALLHPDDQDRCVQRWTESAQTGALFRMQFRLRRYDGLYCWHLAQAKPLLDEQGTVLKWYGCTLQLAAEN